MTERDGVERNDYLLDSARNRRRSNVSNRELRSNVRTFQGSSARCGSSNSRNISPESIQYCKYSIEVIGRKRKWDSGVR